MTESLSIPGRFNGPLDSGNGGYCAGAVAGLLGGAAEVSLRRPVPLDTPLGVVREDDGSVQLLDGEDLIAEGRATPDFDLDVPAPVSPAEARRAATGYRGLTDGVFSRCFVCGRARADAFGVFAGAVDGRASSPRRGRRPTGRRTPGGHVRPELVWAVLDCPTYFALYMDEDLPLSVLARLTGRIDAPVAAGREHVVIAWPIAFDGRKHHAGSAVLSEDGEVLALARALLIQPRGESTGMR